MVKQVPFDKVLDSAKKYKDDMSRFLRDMIAIPSESCDEKRLSTALNKKWKKWVLIKLISIQWAIFWVILVMGLI